MSKIILKTTNLSYTYNSPNEKLEILKNVNLQIVEGEMVGLLGPSGSGKSTFLNCIGLLDDLTSGNIELMGISCVNISESNRTKIRGQQIGFVFQSHRLLPEFSAIENVCIPQLLIGIEKEIAYKKAIEILTFLGLKDRINFRPSKLSGGEAQRVAIARAMINNPKMILADEPTGNLDNISSIKTLELFSKIVKTSNISCLIATHNLELAKKLDRVYTIQNKNLKLLNKQAI